MAWSLFARKVGGGIVEVNKEASMQLHFGYILQQLLPLITFREGEEPKLELEAGVCVDASHREIDVQLLSQSDESRHRIAVELKCYRTKASSGGNRGATDIFMKDVYEDLAILERYMACGHAEEGVALVMTDLERLVHPRNKSAKCHAYDISDGAAFGPISLNTPIGGKSVHIDLTRKYKLEWRAFGKFWFLEVQGEA